MQLEITIFIVSEVIIDAPCTLNQKSTNGSFLKFMGSKNMAMACWIKILNLTCTFTYQLNNLHFSQHMSFVKLWQYY